MNKPFSGVPIRVLLVDDDPGDVYLTQELLRETTLHMEIDVVHDGEKAMAYLRRQGSYAQMATPDLILLDLNMPRKDGRQVLGDIKSDPELHLIPVVVLTTSQADEDIVKS